MRRLQALLIALVVFAVGLAPRAVQSAAQTRPDFSGKWTLVSTSSFAGGPLGRGGTITQDEASVTFTPSLGRTVTYRIDGSENSRTTTTVTGELWDLASQARWVTNALLVTTKYVTNIGRWEDLVVCSLDGDGNLVVVTVSTPKSTQRGMSTETLIYRKD
jgi:hypothetical protein